MSQMRAIPLIIFFVILSALPAVAESIISFEDLEHSGKRWTELINKSVSLSDNHRLTLDEKRKVFCRFGLQALAWGEVYKNELYKAAVAVRILSELSPEPFKTLAEKHELHLVHYRRVYKNCRSFLGSE
jgi:hypothetical protein